MEDIPPEGMTDEESECLGNIRAAVLQAQGRSEPPLGFASHFYLRAQLLRFLKARSDAEQAIAMLVETVTWYDESDYFNGTLRTFEHEDDGALKELTKKYMPEGLYGKDRRGAPVFYIRAGVGDLGSILTEVDTAFYMRGFMYRLESYFDQLYKASIKSGVLLIGFTVVMDLAGLTIASARIAIDILKQLMDRYLRNHFPEITKTIHVLNVPWFFDLAWTFISPFLSEQTHRKVHVHRSNFLEPLQEHVDLSELPTWLGGESPEPWPHGDGANVCQEADKEVGGWVHGAKALHVSNIETLEVEVAAGHTCVWEFHVEAYDIGFSASAGEELLVQADFRVDTTDGWQHGKFTNPTDQPVTVKLTFDNSSSWFHEKDILYKIHVEDLSQNFLSSAPTQLEPVEAAAAA